MCKRFLQLTDDLVATAANFPGGIVALVEARTAAASVIVSVDSGSPSGPTTAAGETTASESTAAPASAWVGRMIVTPPRRMAHPPAPPSPH
jgi:hypothetical protein